MIKMRGPAAATFGMACRCIAGSVASGQRVRLSRTFTVRPLSIVT